MTYPNHYYLILFHLLLFGPNHPRHFLLPLILEFLFLKIVVLHKTIATLKAVIIRIRD